MTGYEACILVMAMLVAAAAAQDEFCLRTKNITDCLAESPTTSGVEEYYSTRIAGPNVFSEGYATSEAVVVDCRCGNQLNIHNASLCGTDYYFDERYMRFVCNDPEALAPGMWAREATPWPLPEDQYDSPQCLIRTGDVWSQNLVETNCTVGNVQYGMDASETWSWRILLVVDGEVFRLRELRNLLVDGVEKRPDLSLDQSDQPRYPQTQPARSAVLLQGFKGNVNGLCYAFFSKLREGLDSIVCWEDYEETQETRWLMNFQANHTRIDGASFLAAYEAAGGDVLAFTPPTPPSPPTDITTTPPTTTTTTTTTTPVPTPSTGARSANRQHVVLVAILCALVAAVQGEALIPQAVMMLGGMAMSLGIASDSEYDQQFLTLGLAVGIVGYSWARLVAEDEVPVDGLDGRDRHEPHLLHL